jgi:hypothetical protein
VKFLRKSYNKNKAKSAELLVGMFNNVEAILYIWQLKSNVHTIPVYTVSQRLFAGTESGEKSGICDREQIVADYFSTAVS